MKKLWVLITVLFSFAVAQDAGLYAPAPPADAAFVRVIHAAPAGGAVALKAADTAYDELSFSQTSPYRVVPGGTTAVSAGDLAIDIDVTAGQFYTLVVGDGELTVLQDNPNTDRAKALLTLVNLSEIALDLKTADGTTDVLASVAPGEQASITVNGIRVALGVFSNGEALALFEETQLERGAAYSVVVFSEGDTVTARWVQSETTTE